jgi:hypothetical protein
MKIITNEKLLKRNRKIGQITTLAGLGILGVGVYLTFQNDAAYISWSFAALIVGFTLSQVSLYIQNRWGRNPRTDETINQSLKGLDDRYTILHYIAPTSHLLVGPCGMVAILPYYIKGTISFKDGRYKQKGGNWYLKVFAQESIGRPDIDSDTAVHSIADEIRKKDPAMEETPSIKSVMLFFDPAVQLDLNEEAPLEAVQIKKLKDYVRRQSKDSRISPDEIDRTVGYFVQPDLQSTKTEVD